jgi:hypothetical protein
MAMRLGRAFLDGGLLAADVFGFLNDAFFETVIVLVGLVETGSWL